MAELLGICGADPEATTEALDRMQAALGAGPLQTARHEAAGIGLLHGHHGTSRSGGIVGDQHAPTLFALDGEAADMAAPTATPSGRVGMPVLRLRRLWRQWDERILERLTGSWALCAYDARRARLTLATDRFASRPLFVCVAGRGLVFGSRFDAVCAGAGAAAGPLDMIALAEALTWQHVPLARTYRRDVRALPPGAAAEFADGRLSVRRYWRVDYGEDPGSRAEFAGRLVRRLRTAGARTVGTDGARLGVMLSGGLDSRLVAAAAPGDMTAFTACDAVNREARTAARVAAQRGWPHVLLRRRPDHYARILDRAVELTGGMVRFDHCAFLELLDPVRQRCGAVLVEDAMDALFKGYYWRRSVRVGGLPVPLPGIARPPRGTDVTEWLLRVGPKSLYATRPWCLLREPWRTTYAGLVREGLREVTEDARTDEPMHLAEHLGGLASPGRTLANLRCVREAVEFRALSLDAGLLELAVRTPVRLRTGRLVRDALRLLDGQLYAIRDANTGLRPDAPAAIGWAAGLASHGAMAVARRLGLATPTATLESWPDRSALLRVPPLRAALESTLADPAALPPELFDTARVAEIVGEHMSGRRNHMRTLLMLLTFGRWFRGYGPADVA